MAIKIKAKGIIDAQKKAGAFIKWREVKKKFLEENLKSDRGGPYSLKMLARDLKINYGTIRNKAGDDNWQEELTTLAAKRDSQATEELMKNVAFDELEVRTRQANFSRFIVSRAMARLQTLKPETLSVKDCIELLRIGLRGEREALGLPSIFEFHPPPLDADGYYEKPIERIKKHDELRRIAGRLLIELQGTVVDDETYKDEP